MLVDILGRAIHDGDIVVVKGSGYGGGFEGSQKRMEVGVAIGNSIHTLTSSRRPRDMFLVMNPSKYELSIKEQVLDKRKKRDKEAKERAKARSVKKANEVGVIYMMSRYKEAFLYLGHKKVESYADDKLMETKEGHLYISLGTWVKDRDIFESYTLNNLSKDWCRISSSRGKLPYTFQIRKGHKTYEEKIGRCIDIKEEFEVKRDCECLINGEKPYNVLTVKVLNI